MNESVTPNFAKPEINIDFSVVKTANNAVHDYMDRFGTINENLQIEKQYFTKFLQQVPTEKTKLITIFRDMLDNLEDFIPNNRINPKKFKENLIAMINFFLLFKTTLKNSIIIFELIAFNSNQAIYGSHGYIPDPEIHIKGKTVNECMQKLYRKLHNKKDWHTDCDVYDIPKKCNTPYSDDIICSVTGNLDSSDTISYDRLYEVMIQKHVFNTATQTDTIYNICKSEFI